MFPTELLPPIEPGPEERKKQSFAWEYLHEIGEEANPQYDELIDRARANYFGMLRLIDDQVKRLYEGLEERHQGRNRIMAVTADHGDYVGAFGLVRKGAEIPELLARIPMVVSGDGIVGALTGVSNESAQSAFVSLADLMPTFCEAMGEEIPISAQGRSLLPMLTGHDYPKEEFASAYIEQGFGGLPYTAADVPDGAGAVHPGIMWDDGEPVPRLDELNSVTQSGRHRKVRSGDWALFAGMTGDFRLFNVREDPYELNNRWDDPTPEVQAVRSALLELLAVWQMRSEDPLPVKDYVRKRDPHGYLEPYSTLPVVPDGVK
jgi:arylsulfatase A-like enzyme